MTVLEWDKVGERIYQSGIDRGVLYLKDGTVVPWNGLTSVDDNTNSELTSYYLDGVKILDHVTPGEFEGVLSAFTYPEEFDRVLGIASIGEGLSFYEQPTKSFNLTYRTKIHSDLDEDYGYKIHLLYNLRATSESQKFETLNDQGNPSQFSWRLTGTPPILTIDGARPTVHVVIDSVNTRADRLESIENTLYGTPTNNPRFPSILEVRIIFGDVSGLYIVDNGNGSWTAIDPSGFFIEMLDSETFEIDHADATYLDADTYTITDTPIPLP